MTSLYQRFGFDQLADWMLANGMSKWASVLSEQVASGLSQRRFGDLKTWIAALDSMPELPARELVPGSTVTVNCDSLSESDRTQLRAALEVLIPWRKGPYSLCGIEIDTEWRSDWKWDRLKDHISPLDNKMVLDVGCGNGYHMWRMLEQNPKRLIGVDPSPRFSIQFEMVRLIAGGQQPIHLVPVALEQVPRALEQFDTVFSMGVIYHRREPLEHIRELRDCLRVGGELILESLVVEGDEDAVLVPGERYAKMRNVWQVPSSARIKHWLENEGFVNIRLIDESTTTIEEQRSTDWMRFESLPDFLDPLDNSKTVEGYPAPRRSIILAQKG